jgi:hypothetical protein
MTTNSKTPRKKNKTPDVLVKLSLPQPTRVYDLYWKFAVERQNIFFRRLRGDSIVTLDPILQEYKFTNAYRASDRVSQFLIREVLYKGSQLPSELFFRCLIFKTFNRIETWQLLEKELGPVTWSNYNYDSCDKIFTDATARGICIYSPAYMHPSFGAGLPYKRKHQCHLKLIERMMGNGLPQALSAAESMSEAFKLIRGYTMIGDFLAYQYVTDLNYSVLLDFPESDFTSPGPGCIGGISKCFSDLGDLTETDIIRMVADRQHQEFEARGIQFSNLWGRDLQLIDCQNLFCETDKYARVAAPDVRGKSEGTRIKQKYKSKYQKFIQLQYPPKWGLDESLNTIPPVPKLSSDVLHPPDDPSLTPVSSQGVP